MRAIAIAILTLTAACHDCPTPPDDAPDDSSSDSSSEDSGSSDESSSGGETVAPYGPCEVNDDCPIVPGDDGFVAPEARCFQGTCSYYCGSDPNIGVSHTVACPWYLDYQQHDPPYYPIGCASGWCGIGDTLDRDDPAPCPEGMFQGDPEAMPRLGCVWEMPEW